jgi:uncharacterized protein (DUF305 family)
MMLHHQGAINTNWKALQKSQRPQIKDLVENLVAPQKKKIELIKQSRKDW